MSNNLLDQWNEHIIRGNQLSRDLEDFEGIMHVADMTNSTIAIYDGTGTTFIWNVLTPEKMAEIKGIVISSLTEARAEKEKELKKLMGLWKPAIINPEFEAAVQAMEQSHTTKKNCITGETITVADPVEEKLTEILQEEAKRIEDKPEPPAMTEELIKELYHDKDMTLDEVAKVFGTNRTTLYKFITANNLRKPSKRDKSFMDDKVEAKQKMRSETECL